MDKTLYIVSSGRLAREKNTLIFETQHTKKFFPINTIDEIYIFSEVSLNSKVLNFLSQNGIIVHFFNYYGYYSGSFYPRERYVSGELLVLQVENYINEEKRLYLAKSFVDGGIYHILRNLGDKDVVDELKGKYSHLYDLKTIEEIMNLEGSIRKIYYKHYFGLLVRKRKPPIGPVNALISFGNSLMYATILKEIYKTQLNPTVSYLHEPSFRRFSLALDLSEIFKPLIIDPLVNKLISKGILEQKDFSEELNYCYLNEEGRRKFLKHYENVLSRTVKHRKLKRKVSYRFLIRLECYKLIKHFLGDEIYKPLKAWW